MFNRHDDLNEKLVEGREDIFFASEFASKGATPTAIPASSVAVYVRVMRRRGAVHASLQCYRALETTMEQNRDRRHNKLLMPVLAIDGAPSRGEIVGADFRQVAEDVTTLTVVGCVHYIAEEAPDQTVEALQAFLVTTLSGT